MSYAVFAENRLVAVCDSFKEAIGSMPPESKRLQIFNENKEEILFIKRGDNNERKGKNKR